MKRLTAWCLGAAALIGAAGCYAPPSFDRGEVANLVDDRGQRRSLAFDSEAHRNAFSAQASDGVPWYLSRNDAQPTVSAGLELPTFEASHTRTIDRQRQHNGRVHDDLHISTYRSRTRQTVR